MSATVRHLAPADTLAAEAGRTVKARMEAERWSARQIAPLLGISNAAVGRRLSGEVDFSVTEIYRLAEILRCSPMDLLPQRGVGPHTTGPDAGDQPHRGDNGNTNWYNRASLALVGAAA